MTKAEQTTALKVLREKLASVRHELTQRESCAARLERAGKVVYVEDRIAELKKIVVLRKSVENLEAADEAVSNTDAYER